MSRLGYDRSTGFVYEGRFEPAYPVWPTPLLSQAHLVKESADYQRIPNGFESDLMAWIFREESFDPVSRVRRGRLFQKFGNSSADSVHVQPHSASHVDQRHYEVTSRLIKELAVFSECREILSMVNRGEGALLALGAQASFSVWRIVQTELTLNSDVMVTLRAQSNFGVVPALKRTAFRHENVEMIENALQRVSDAAYKELPTSVVDQTRNAAVVVTSRWMQEQLGEDQPREQDLGAWILCVDKHFTEKPRTALLSALRIINTLHPRGKENERVRHGVREVHSEDAVVALHCLAFAMREMGATQD